MPFEDVLFTDFNRKGASTQTGFERVRLYFEPDGSEYFTESRRRAVTRYFFGIPTNSGVSDYRVSGNHLWIGERRLGTVRHMTDDTCNSTYARENGDVLVLNARSKSACRGCKFCHTFRQTPKDIYDIPDEDMVPKAIEEWLGGQEKADLSHVRQISILTGCFGGEQKVAEHLRLVRKASSRYGFKGELLYFGSEIRSEDALKSLSDASPFGLCLSLECFYNREKILRREKASLTLEQAKAVLSLSKEMGFTTCFSYVLGLESLQAVSDGMKDFAPHITRIPVINIFQPHLPSQSKLLSPEARSLEYFLDARKMLESVFGSIGYKPNTWENYRSPWYLKFGDEYLTGARVPSMDEHIARKHL
ncbi:MAG: hypothetical protein HYW23_01800 [Candidatus Aenigmarchaeota archaeon]|nr:hypothetical protein [Candidatus Aenigmarchaeota archaeon]